jgi:hypothetical protein
LIRTDKLVELTKVRFIQAQIDDIYHDLVNFSKVGGIPAHPLNNSGGVFLQDFSNWGTHGVALFAFQGRYRLTYRGVCEAHVKILNPTPPRERVLFPVFPSDGTYSEVVEEVKLYRSGLAAYAASLEASTDRVASS